MNMCVTLPPLLDIVYGFARAVYPLLSKHVKPNMILNVAQRLIMVYYGILTHGQCTL